MTLRSQTGFTLIEIMVVVVILGILAGIVVPRLLDRPDEARRTKASVQIRSIEETLGLYKLDNGFYPTTDQGLRALVTKPTTGKIPKKFREGGYLRKVPKDPWDNDYIFLSPGLHGDFDVISYGADGEQGGEGKNADINSWEIE
ncbi:MAG: type II secretion system major pseudopilin GspG [Desulfuromonadales bacterium]|nr:type II secretion system major pseudopilin GspG [Desulfuromonadales bacterium]MDT8423920.1 type II secretion system major pseudopilin GspG [Desulfuromonadales bacterium]